MKFGRFRSYLDDEARAEERARRRHGGEAARHGEQPASRPSAPRPQRAERPADSAISRMLDAARPSGRLPALSPRGADDARARYVDKWRKLMGGTPGAPREVRPIYEPSKYADRDDREDDDER